MTMKRVAFLVCLSVLLVAGVVFGAFIWPSGAPPLSKNSAPHPSPSNVSSSNAEKLARDRRLEQIMLDKFRDSGVVKVEVDDSIMSVHVTPEVYRAMFADRVEGNRIMRGWQTLIAQNYGTTGVGAVGLYSDGHKMAEADLHIWSGEIKVKWLDD